MSRHDQDGEWARRPRTEDLPDQWRIMRAGAGGHPASMILSEDTVGAYTHFWGGRTRLCLKNDCEPCSKGRVPRWRGYVAVVSSKSGKFGILELTPMCVPDIERFMKERPTLRGAIITLSRKGKKENGQLECVLEWSPGNGTNLPPCPDVLRHLRRIWRLTHEPLPTEHQLDARTVLRDAGFLGRGEATNGRPQKPADAK